MCAAADGVIDTDGDRLGDLISLLILLDWLEAEMWVLRKWVSNKKKEKEKGKRMGFA